jgi:hypothetical protein
MVQSTSKSKVGDAEHARRDLNDYPLGGLGSPPNTPLPPQGRGSSSLPMTSTTSYRATDRMARAGQKLCWRNVSKNVPYGLLWGHLWRIGFWR